MLLLITFKLKLLTCSLQLERTKVKYVIRNGDFWAPIYPVWCQLESTPTNLLLSTRHPYDDRHKAGKTGIAVQWSMFAICADLM